MPPLSLILPAVFSDGHGIHHCAANATSGHNSEHTPWFQEKLPSSVAPLVAYTAGIENLAVEAWEKKSKQLVYQAVSLDPLCSAVLSLQEIRDMCDELFAVNRDYLGDYI